MSDVLPSILEEQAMIEEMEGSLKKRNAREDVPPEIAAAAKAAKEAAWMRVLQKLQMTEGDMENIVNIAMLLVGKLESYALC